MEKGGTMVISVEVFDCSEAADEATALRILRETKKLDAHAASRPFGQLFWHKRPFTFGFPTSEEASKFLEQLDACGYRGRLVSPSADNR